MGLWVDALGFRAESGDLFIITFLNAVFEIAQGITPFIALVTLVLSENLPFSLGTMVLILLAVVVGVYYVLMAFFGSSLVASAVGGDGMMMVSRGRAAWFIGSPIPVLWRFVTEHRFLKSF